MPDFDDALVSLGFRKAGSRRNAEWTMQATPYLVFSVLGQDDGEALFTWECAIGELMGERGLHVGTSDPLQVFMYPERDARGPATREFVEAEMRRVTAQLSGVDLTGRG